MNGRAAVHWLRQSLVARTPRRPLHVVASLLARGRPLAVEPSWQLRVVDDDRRQLTLLRHDIWNRYRENGIERPIVYRWYDGLRVYLFLGNRLSLSLYVLGSFEPNELVFMQAALAPGMVVVDGGANDGLFSLFAARRVQANGLVLAVEPSTREFARLTANVELNDLSNVRLVRVALGSHVGEAMLAVAEAGEAGMNALGSEVSSSSPAVRTDARENVPLTTIDALIDRFELRRLDFIKLDIEGSEVDALAGALAAISRFRPTILLEVESARLACQGRTKEDLIRTVTKLGYELWVFDAGSAQLRPANLPAEPEGNAVAAPHGWQPPALS